MSCRHVGTSVLATWHTCVHVCACVHVCKSVISGLSIL